MRALSFAAFIVGILLIPTALGVAKFDRDRDISEIERTLVAETDEHGGSLESYFARARVDRPADRATRRRSPGCSPSLAPARRRWLGRAATSLTSRISSATSSSSTPRASAKRASSTPTARSSPAQVRGEIAKPGDLSTVEEQAGFFAPTFALNFGQVHQTRPYVSPDTKEWVVANATLIPQADRQKRAFVHFEVTVESFRRAMGAAGQGLRAARHRQPHRQGRHRQRPPAADRRCARRAARRALHGARPREPAPPASPRSTDTRPPTATSSRRRATPTTGSSSLVPRRRPAASSRGSGRSRSRCSGSRC